MPDADSLYPEHAKMAKIMPRSQPIGEFLTWLLVWKGRVLCEWRDEVVEPLTDYKGRVLVRPMTGETRTRVVSEAGFYPITMNIEQLLGEYFGIDVARIHAEKEAMYELMRAQNSQEGGDADQGDLPIVGGGGEEIERTGESGRTHNAGNA